LTVLEAGEVVDQLLACPLRAAIRHPLLLVVFNQLEDNAVLVWEIQQLRSHDVIVNAHVAVRRRVLAVEIVQGVRVCANVGHAVLAAVPEPQRHDALQEVVLSHTTLFILQELQLEESALAVSLLHLCQQVLVLPAECDVN